MSCQAHRDHARGLCRKFVCNVKHRPLKACHYARRIEWRNSNDNAGFIGSSAHRLIGSSAHRLIITRGADFSIFATSDSRSGAFIFPASSCQNSILARTCPGNSFAQMGELFSESTRTPGAMELRRQARSAMELRNEETSNRAPGIAASVVGSVPRLPKNARNHVRGDFRLRKNGGNDVMRGLGLPKMAPHDVWPVFLLPKMSPNVVRGVFLARKIPANNVRGDFLLQKNAPNHVRSVF